MVIVTVYTDVAAMGRRVASQNHKDNSSETARAGGYVQGKCRAASPEALTWIECENQNHRIAGNRISYCPGWHDVGRYR